MSLAAFDSIRQHAEAFDRAAAFSHCCGEATVTIGGDQWSVDRMFVSGDFFSTLDIVPAVGRLLTNADDVPGGGPDGPAAVIGYGLWRERFGGRADVVGRSILLDRIPVTIVGVAPRSFLGIDIGRSFDVILPARTEPVVLPSIAFNDHTVWLTVMLRLKPGVSRTAAEASLRAAQPQIRANVLSGNSQSGFLNAPFTLTPIGGGLSALRERFERPLVALLIVVAVVLLVACANVANLQLARAAARRHELSVRVALGASRVQLAQQWFVESMLLAAAGTLAGL